MSDEPKKSVSESLRDWGIDVEKFEERAKESFQSARGDLSEITGTLRQTLVEAKDVLVGLQRGGSAPAAAELKSGFERAWQEIERAFTTARQRAKDGTKNNEPPASEEPPSPS
ncbi:MAG TPA: hypothetical protein VJZ00_24640 [Thermoanaerobaculia bacterium]|nr:hypothetical protein [Thermoanaerobaculia bacterium]